MVACKSFTEKNEPPQNIDNIISLTANPTPPPKREDPCFPSPCGSNARCHVENNYAVCECIPQYHGNPYENCRPECLSNSDCPMNRACIRNKCQDPCPGTCGVNALCLTTNHIPVCSCPDRFTGDAFRFCTAIVGKCLLLLFTRLIDLQHLSINKYVLVEKIHQQDLLFCFHKFK